MKKIHFLFMLLFITSCEFSKEHSRKNKTHQLVLSKQEKRLMTDSSTANFSSFVQFINKDEAIVTFSHITNMFTVFNAKSGSIVKKIKLDTELYGKFLGGTFLDNDSFLAVSPKGVLFLFDEKQKLVKKSSFIDYSNISVRATARTPIIKTANKAFIAGMYMGSQNFSPVLYINDLDTIFNEVDILPNSYKNQLWAATELENIYWTLNENVGKIFVSFPAENYVVWFSVSKPAEKGLILMKSEKIDTIISPIKSIEMVNEMSDEELLNVYFENDSYRNIIYDKYRNIFYRFAEFRTDEKYKNGQKIYKQFSIMTYNDKMEKLSEDYFEADWNYSSFFVAPDGLYLYNRLKSEQNEDIMFFDLFEFKEIKQ